MEKLGTIYKITSPNNKGYIGQTVQRVERRWAQHYSTAFNKKSKSYNLPLQRAIRKYGWHSFKKEILIQTVEIDKLDGLEVSYQLEHKTSSKKYGYNIIIGPSNKSSKRGFSPSKKTRSKISKTLIGNIPWNKGIPHSEETKKKLRTINLGKKLSDSVKEKITKNSPLAKPVACYDSYDTIIKVYHSAHEATRIDSIDCRRILECIKGKRPKYKGLYWKEIKKSTYLEFFESTKSINPLNEVKEIDIIFGMSKPVAQFSKDGILIKIYKSSVEASNLNGFNRKNIYSCASGNQACYKNYVWKYISKEDYRKYYEKGVL